MNRFIVRTPGDEIEEPAEIGAETMEVAPVGVLVFRDAEGVVVAAYSDWTEAYRVHEFV